MPPVVECVEPGRLDRSTLEALRRLWWAAFDDFTEDDAAHALGGLHVVVGEGGEVLSHAAAVPRTLWVGGRRLAAAYVEAVATAPAHRGRGLGSAVLRRLAAELPGRAEVAVLSTGAHGFYERLGWQRWRGPSYVVEAGGGRQRTEEDDDGLMVLLLPGSPDLDLTADLACEDRPGDAW